MQAQGGGLSDDKGLGFETKKTQFNLIHRNRKWVSAFRRMYGLYEWTSYYN